MKMSGVILVSALSALGAYASASYVRSDARKTVENAKVEALDNTQVKPVVTPKTIHSAVREPSVRRAQTRPVKMVQVPTTAKPMARPVRKKSYAAPFSVRRCMNIGNALEAPNEGEWGYTIRAKDFQTVARAGFDSVRIPIRWDNHTSEKAPYLIDPRFMTRVQRVVGDARTVGLNVIIDVHHYEDLMVHTNREEARFLSIWDQIGRAFSNAPPSVYFEVLNEPTLKISSKRLNALYAKVIPVIRSTNPSRKIIMGGNSWNSVESLADVVWPKDANIVATFHDYGPHEFTHQGAEWMSPPMPMGRKWLPNSADIAELKSTYDMALAFKAKTGMPVLVGEFGVIDKVPQSQRNSWIRARRKTMESAGFSWCAWDFSGAFKAYDTNTERWAPGVLDAYTGR